MDSSGYFLLLIVIAAVIALIYIAKKQSSLDDPTPTPKPDPKPEPKPDPKPEPSGPPQNTIYSFSSTSTKRLCPFCDGENQYSAKTCIICGRDLS